MTRLTRLEEQGRVPETPFQQHQAALHVLYSRSLPMVPMAHNTGQYCSSAAGASHCESPSNIFQLISSLTQHNETHINNLPDSFTPTPPPPPQFLYCNNPCMPWHPVRHSSSDPTPHHSTITTTGNTKASNDPTTTHVIDTAANSKASQSTRHHVHLHTIKSFLQHNHDKEQSSSLSDVSPLAISDECMSALHTLLEHGCDIASLQHRASSKIRSLLEEAGVYESIIDAQEYNLLLIILHALFNPKETEITHAEASFICRYLVYQTCRRLDTPPPQSALACIQCIMEKNAQACMNECICLLASSLSTSPTTLINSIDWDVVFEGDRGVSSRVYCAELITTVVKQKIVPVAYIPRLMDAVCSSIVHKGSVPGAGTAMHGDGTQATQLAPSVTAPFVVSVLQACVDAKPDLQLIELAPLADNGRNDTTTISDSEKKCPPLLASIIEALQYLLDHGEDVNAIKCGKLILSLVKTYGALIKHDTIMANRIKLLAVHNGTFMAKATVHAVDALLL